MTIKSHNTTNLSNEKDDRLRLKRKMIDTWKEMLEGWGMVYARIQIQIAEDAVMKMTVDEALRWFRVTEENKMEIVLEALNKQEKVKEEQNEEANGDEKKTEEETKMN